MKDREGSCPPPPTRLQPRTGPRLTPRRSGAGDKIAELVHRLLEEVRDELATGELRDVVGDAAVVVAIEELTEDAAALAAAHSDRRPWPTACLASPPASRLFFCFALPSAPIRIGAKSARSCATCEPFRPLAFETPLGHRRLLVAEDVSEDPGAVDRLRVAVARRVGEHHARPCRAVRERPPPPPWPPPPEQAADRVGHVVATAAAPAEKRGEVFQDRSVVIAIERVRQ